MEKNLSQAPDIPNENKVAIISELITRYQRLLSAEAIESMGIDIQNLTGDILSRILAGDQALLQDMRNRLTDPAKNNPLAIPPFSVSPQEADASPEMLRSAYILHLMDSARGFLKIARTDGKPSHFYFSNVAGSVHKFWTIDTPLEEIEENLKDNGWIAEMVFSDYAGEVVANFSHTKSMTELREMLQCVPPDATNRLGPTETVKAQDSL